MLFTYLIAFFIYFGILSVITKDSPYKSAYSKGVIIALPLWFITMFLSQGFIVGFSGINIDYPREEVEGRIFLTNIIDWVSFFIYHISLPLIFKNLSAKKDAKK